MKRLFFSVLLLLAFCISSDAFTPPTSFCTNGPTDYVAYWPLDGDFNDASPNGHHATAFGSLTFTGAKYLQGVTGFGPGNYFQLPNLNLTTATLTAWVYVNAHATQKIFRGLAYPENGSPCIGEFETQWEACGTSFGPLTLSTWHHIAMVDGVGIYIDGELKTGVFPNMDPSVNNLVNVGGLPYFEWFNGTVDDIKYYDRSLTENEVKSMAEKRYVSLNNGAFSNPSNWLYGCTPPNPVPADVTVVIDSDLSINSGETITVNGNMSIATGKTLTNNGTMIFATGTNFTNLGIYNGSGDFTGNFINLGTVNPGNSK